MFTFLKRSFKVTMFIVAGTAGVAYITKPYDDGFKMIFAKEVPFIPKSITNPAIDEFIEIEDHVLFKTVRFIGDDQPAFIGVFGRWIQLHKE